jgi:hypothetical protein
VDLESGLNDGPPKFEGTTQIQRPEIDLKKIKLIISMDARVSNGSKGDGKERGTNKM